MLPTFYNSFDDSNFIADFALGELAVKVNQSCISNPTGKFGPAISILGGVSLKYISYFAALNAQSDQTGTIEFFYAPGYTGGPASLKTIVCLCKNDGSPNNMIHLEHAPGGQLQYRVFDQNGTAIFSNNLGVWSPVADQFYFISINYDITTGQSRVFVQNGTQCLLFNAINTGTGTRNVSASASNYQILIGTDGALSTFADALYDDFAIYSSVQRTATFNAPTSRVSLSPDLCTVWGYCRDISGTPRANVSIGFTLQRAANQYVEANHSVITQELSVKTDVNGRMSIPLIRTSQFEGTNAGKYLISVQDGKFIANTIDGTAPIVLTVPDQDYADITALLTVP